MSAEIHLRLIGTSDLHANIYPYDYYRDRPDETVGLARTASLIAAARAEAANTILLDNGDVIQGTPLGDRAAQPDQSGEVHPMIAVMNRLGYAAAALGNHEFNYGLELLEAAVRAADFPFLSCNILKPDGDFYFRPWTILERSLVDAEGVAQPLRIGVIGFTTPQIVQWDQSHLAGRATTIGIAEAAATHLPTLRALGADLVVALCHSGVSRKSPAVPGEENAALALAAVGGVDAMLTGHQHLLLPGADFQGIDGVDAARGALRGVPAFMPGFWGSHLGVIDLVLDRTKERWRVARSEVSARPIYRRDGEAIHATVESDPAALAVAKAAHEATLAYTRAPVGAIASPINSYFALVANDPSVRIVNAAQTWYLERLARTVPSLAGPPILSASAPFKCGGRGGPDYYTDVAAGPVAIRNVADIYIYPNGLRVVRISGALVREWLERSASLFRRIDPDAKGEQALLDADFTGYNFDVIDGLTYAIDVTRPARYDSDGRLVAPDSRRIVDPRFGGDPIDLDAEFLVATNSYRASGGGSFPGCDGSTIVFEAPDSNRDALVRYIVENRRVEPRSRGGWRFAPWPAEAIVTFPSSPAAAAAATPEGITITPMGSAPGGFATYRLELGRAERMAIAAD
jgi:2',3'-cyclic-nucleotide 2'-phosphodiesterase/3'-nucleotidase